MAVILQTFPFASNSPLLDSLSRLAQKSLRLGLDRISSPGHHSFLRSSPKPGNEPQFKGKLSVGSPSLSKMLFAVRFRQVLCRLFLVPCSFACFGKILPVNRK